MRAELAAEISKITREHAFVDIMNIFKLKTPPLPPPLPSLKYDSIFLADLYVGTQIGDIQHTSEKSNVKNYQPLFGLEMRRPVLHRYQSNLPFITLRTKPCILFIPFCYIPLLCINCVTTKLLVVV